MIEEQEFSVYDASELRSELFDFSFDRFRRSIGRTVNKTANHFRQGDTTETIRPVWLKMEQWSKYCIGKVSTTALAK